jgi:hypothetical protein
MSKMIILQTNCFIVLSKMGCKKYFPPAVFWFKFFRTFAV